MSRYDKRRARFRHRTRREARVMVEFYVAELRRRNHTADIEASWDATTEETA